MTELSFASMNLSEPMLRVLAEVGYDAPTAVQAQCFGPVAEGRDVIVQSRTGSGKTAAFALPLIDRVLRPERVVQALVLCPTRELALQVHGEVERLGRTQGVSVAAVYGGAPMGAQIAALEAGVHVVVGTPGRVLDHLRRKTLRLEKLRSFVLDEGDEMLSMGFAEELHAILEFVPRARQGMIFSATMPEGIQRIAQRHLKDPEFLTLSSDHVAPSELTHYVYYSSAGNQARELAKILQVEQVSAALIFCNTRSETEQLARALQGHGLRAEYLNGDLAQSDRERVLGLLREGKVPFLVATDVAARGLDVPHLSHVVNVGFPESPETYVHRTGRTGRAGRKGVAISMVGPQNIGNLYLLRLTYGIRPIERALPSEGEERTRRELDRLALLLEAFPTAPTQEAVALARRLLTHDDHERIVASLVGEFFDLGRRQALELGLEPSVTVAVPVAVPPRPAVDHPPQEATPERSSEPVGDATRERPPRRERRETEGAVPRERTSPRVGPPAPERPRRVPVHHAERGAPQEDDESGMEELRLAVGRRDGVRPGEVARLLRDTARLGRQDVGRIHVRDRITLVGIRAEHLQSTLEALKDTTYNDRPVSPERGRSTGSNSAAAAPDADD